MKRRFNQESSMRKSFLILLVVLGALCSPALAESPAEAKKAEIDRLHQAMGVAGSPAEYEDLKSQWETAVSEYRRLKAEEKAEGDKDAACKSSINECNSSYKERDYSNAKMYAETALKACPGNFKALYMLAKSERKLGEFSAALGHLDEAMAADPEDVRPMIEKGEMLAEDMGRLAEGLALLDQAAQKDPSKADDAYYNKGQILLKQKNFAAAASAFEQTVAARADYTPAWVALANCYYELKNPAKTLRAAEGALKDSNYRGRSEVLFFQAAAYRMNGQYDSAIGAAASCLDDINRLRRNKSYIQGGAHYETGLSLEAKGSFAQAIAAFDKAVGFREWKSSATYEIERIKREQGL
jgi:tetratricopeptide (TPR) repeat protein